MLDVFPLINKDNYSRLLKTTSKSSHNHTNNIKMKVTFAAIAVALAAVVTAQPIVEERQTPGNGRPSGVSGGPEAASKNPQTYTNGSLKWNYQGCFSDRSDKEGRALDDFYASSTQRTVEGCLRTCGNRGFQYAGLEYGSECRCANELQSFSKIDAQCNKKCSSNNGQTCGGNYALTLYKSEKFGP